MKSFIMALVAGVLRSVKASFVIFDICICISFNLFFRTI